MLTIDGVRRAAALLEGCVLRTPLAAAPRLSALCGAEVLVKYENMQATGSFKERGAATKLMRLSDAQRARGVIAVSAGNHALALAHHGSRLGAPVTVVMPAGTPAVKIENAERLGARVLIEGANLDEAYERCRAVAAAEGLTLVHPYDDPDVICGQGTIALEILEDRPDVDVVLVPIGGGGLIAGTAIVAQALAPHVEVIGVESKLYPSFHCALHGGLPPRGGATLAEGIAVKQVGALALPIVKSLVCDILLVSETDIERAVACLAVNLHTMAEGAGAASLAALLAQPERFAGRRVAAILSGGNIDPRMLAAVMMRDLEREDRIVTFRATLDDRPGLLGLIATRLGALGANILEVSHQRLLLDVPAKGVSLDVTVETRNRAHAEDVLAALEREGLSPRRVTSGRDEA